MSIPGWGNDVLPLLMSGLGTVVDAIRCQEIFDYSTYEQEESVGIWSAWAIPWTTSR